MIGMDEHITFGMPLGFLRHSIEGGDLGKMFQPPGLLEHSDAERGLHGLGGPLVPFAPDAFDGQLLIGVGNGPAQGGRFRRQRQFKARGQLKGSQHAQGILAERGTGVPQNPLF
jgi:hypothetical protein